MEVSASTKVPKTNTLLQVYGTFYLGGDEFAIAMADLQEVVNAPEKLQKMPLSPGYLLGLFNLRGCVLPVVDLRVLLKSEAVNEQVAITPRMVVLRRGSARLGLLFDAVGEILRVLPSDLAPIIQQNLSEDVATMPVKAVICRDEGERIIQVLDLGALLAIRNLPLIERMTSTEDAKGNLTARMKDLYREKLIGFSVGECNMALEMKCIVAVIQNKSKKPSPCRSELCASVIPFQGRLIPVIEVSGLLRIPTVNVPRHILICKIGSDHVGLEVDCISSIIPYAKEKILPIPVLDEHRSSTFHGCFTDRDGIDFIVLNEEGLLSDAEIATISMNHKKLIGQDQTVAAAKVVTPQVSLLTFRMGKLYGLKLLDVVEVLTCPPELACIPNMPPAVLGILNLRGTPLSVVDPRCLFDLELVEEPASSRLLVFQHENRKIAMRVDSVESIISVSTGDDEELPPIFFGTDGPRLKDTFERGVHVVSNGCKSVVLILKSGQIAKCLSDALAT